MKKRILAVTLVAVAAVATALWIHAARRPAAAPRPDPRPANAPGQTPAGPTPVPIRDGATIDFSGGTAVVREGAQDKAAIDAAVKKMDAAAADVTFPASTPEKK